MEKWRKCSDDFIMGHDLSPCLPPCQRTRFKTILMEKTDPQEGKPYVSITILEKYALKKLMIFFIQFLFFSVHVTTHVLVRTNFNTLMSFVGANMGFWLGVGALQILMSLLDFARDKFCSQSKNVILLMCTDENIRRERVMFCKVPASNPVMTSLAPMVNVKGTPTILDDSIKSQVS